jgi:hypothetical protein
MLDVLGEVSQDDESDSPEEDVEAVDSEEVQDLALRKGKRILTRAPKYYSRQQQLELVMAAQELLRYGEHDEGGVRSVEQETSDEDAVSNDIWENEVCLELLKGGVIPNTADLQTIKRARKRAIDYCWKDNQLYFKGLYVPRPEERVKLVSQMHDDLGHFEEQRILAEVCRRYFWNNRIECVKVVVRMCQQCQLVKSVGSVRFGDKQLKSIPVHDLFYRSHWIWQDRCLRLSQATNISWWLSTTIRSGAKPRQ